MLNKAESCVERERGGGVEEENKRGRDSRGLVINARSETAVSRPMFSSGMRHRRCLIPASCFYEWDKSHYLAGFTLPGQPVMFMAGCYDVFDGVCRFVILTTEANESVRPVHSRMPLLIAQDSLFQYLGEGFEQCLQATMPALQRDMALEQLSFFPDG